MWAVFLLGWTEGASPANAQQAFTDDPLVARATPVKAVHVTELQQAIDILQGRWGLGVYSWTTPTSAPARTEVRAIGIGTLYAGAAHPAVTRDSA